MWIRKASLDRELFIILLRVVDSPMMNKEQNCDFMSNCETFYFYNLCMVYTSSTFKSVFGI